MENLFAYMLSFHMEFILVLGEQNVKLHSY